MTNMEVNQALLSAVDKQLRLQRNETTSKQIANTYRTWLQGVAKAATERQRQEVLRENRKGGAEQAQPQNSAGGQQ